MAMGTWFHKPGTASEKALLVADQSDLDEMLGWGGLYQVQNEVQDEIENITFSKTSNKVCVMLFQPFAEKQMSWLSIL